MENPPAAKTTTTRRGEKSWSIHTRREITTKYKITTQIGSGAYSTVYSASRISDGIHVALKEVHHYPSALREIQALQTLSSSSSSEENNNNNNNVVNLIEFFWRGDEDAVLVLGLMRSDLGAVIEEGRRRENGIGVAEAKGWIVQRISPDFLLKMWTAFWFTSLKDELSWSFWPEKARSCNLDEVLAAVEACHSNGIMHRDLKPSNVLVSAEGVVKLADFGQARILQESQFVNYEQTPPFLDQNSPNPPSHQAEIELSGQDGSANEEDKSLEFDRGSQEGDMSCLATCATSDLEGDSFRDSYSYEEEEHGVDEENGALTSCVGTRWFRAPELLYGSTNYGLEVDLWSLGCIFAELFSLKPLFPGTFDIDQLGIIFNVMGNITEEVWPGCSQLPDYNIISFSKVENPLGLEACVPNRSPREINFLKKLLCFDPANRVSASELLNDEYLKEEPLPIPAHELKVPSSRSAQNEGSSGEWGNYKDMDSDSDFDDFGPMNVSTTDTGFTIRFS